jgi:predicted RecA/RadA family phage recombinase
VGTIFGVAYHDAVTGQEVEISREGVFNLAAVAADVAASGAPAYWDNTARAVTTAAAVGNILIGAFAVSKSGATTVARVVIDGTIRLALV